MSAGDSPYVLGVILAGGRGERLWPLTRERRPKPLLQLGGGPTLLAQAVSRLESAGIARGQQRIVGELRHAAALEAAAPGVQVLLEPVGYNTAHSVALAALHAERAAPDPIIVVVPSDHVIRRPAALIEGLRKGIACAHATRRLVAFGVTPAGVSTAYGHLRPGKPVAGSDALELVDYVEKPDGEKAAAMTASGAYLWNCGNFVFPVRELLAAFRRFEPEIVEAAASLEGALRQAPASAAAAEAYARGPHLSVDHALMEAATAAGLCAVVPVDFDRIDAGNLASLAALFPADEHGNSATGASLFVDAQRCFTSSSGPLAVVLGLHDVVTVVEDDIVFVCSRERAMDVRRVLAAVRSKRREDLL